MKMKWILATVLSSVVLLISCQKDVNNYYKGKDKIQFKYYTLDFNKQMILNNQSTFSFGMIDDDIVADTAKIVVEFLGTPADVDRTYKVKIATDSTSAKEGVHFAPISPTQTLRAGRFDDTLKILVYRGNLSTSFTNPEDVCLGLEMEESDDFELGMKDGLRFYLYINNYLSEPVWWDTPLRGSYIGFYHPKKWKILISFNERFSNPETCPFDVNNEGRQYFQGLANYLNAVPTFDDETGYRIYIDRLEP